MSTIGNVRKGYETIGHGSLADGRREAYGVLDTRDVAEVGSVRETIGEVAAVVYALSLLGADGDLARDLRRLGPWSWTLDVWYCADAFGILSDAVDELNSARQYILNNVTFADDDTVTS